MTTFNRGDVVYIPFEFTDRGKLKNRPGVVISSTAFHESRRDVVIAGITSNLNREHFVGHLVLGHWAECGLVKPSAISGIIQTIRDSQVRQRIGSLSSHDQIRLDAMLREVLGL
jgi:mRNA interferase MazF